MAMIGMKYTISFVPKLDPNEINKRKLLGTEIKYIRLGLEKGFDVSIYNKPEYDYAQMEAIL